MSEFTLTSLIKCLEAIRAEHGDDDVRVYLEDTELEAEHLGEVEVEVRFGATKVNLCPRSGGRQLEATHTTSAVYRLSETGQLQVMRRPPMPPPAEWEYVREPSS